jgi:hypothetical protein
MKNTNGLLMWMSLVSLTCSTVHAQGDYEKMNAHVGVTLSVPLNQTANYVHTGWGVVTGAGYNFSAHHSIIGEFMWNRFHATEGALQPLRAQAQNLDGHSNLYALTGNYRYESLGKRFGYYFIAGGGLYYRTTNPSERVTSGTGTTCTPTWLWWGFKCVSGTVVPNQEIGSAGSNAFGGNGGIGFTARVGEAPYRLYVEGRYHYAPNKSISTKLATVSVGIRY